MPAPIKNCDYVLLAEFDIDEGSTLRHEYPVPTGCNTHLLAELMLPDGVHQRAEDWTVFYLNQTQATAVRSELTEESVRGAEDTPGPANASTTSGNDGLLYTISLVRTKHGSAYKRGALVKAMAVCSRHPYIQIFKPILLLALEDYFNEPTPSVLKRLFDAINDIDISSIPSFTASEKLILRNTERKDLFEERFDSPSTPNADDSQTTYAVLSDTRSITSGSTAINPASRSVTPVAFAGPATAVNETSKEPSNASNQHLNLPSTFQNLPRSRVASDSSLNPPSSAGLSPHPMQRTGSSANSSSATARIRGLRDTHFYDTEVNYNNIALPIRLPLSAFENEVGDYSLITLIQTFSNFTSSIGPTHPQLHTNGTLTPPVIVLFNALVTYKRVIFLGGTNQPASIVSNFVLAAAALASGCGLFFGKTVQRRAFPYSNLTNLEHVEKVPGFIAGVSNPRFLDLTSTWDVLCNIETGRIHISKDIQTSSAAGASAVTSGNPNASSLSISTNSSATYASAQHSGHRANNSSVDLSTSPEPMSAVSGSLPFSLHGNGIQSLASSTNAPRKDSDGESGRPLQSDGYTSSKGSMMLGKMEQRLDSQDNVFMDEILSAIHAHFGESVIRARFIEYMRRFLRLASRYEEDTLGHSSIDFPTRPYDAVNRRLGSGMIFPNLSQEEVRREIAYNSGRIEGFRRTMAYEDYKSSWMTRDQYVTADSRTAAVLKNVDLLHQLGRLRNAKKMPTDEVEAILRTLLGVVQTGEGLIELLSHLPSHLGGLLPVSFGLFHPSPLIREYTVQLFDALNAHAIGSKFLQSLNAFHKLAYSRLAKEREHNPGIRRRQDSTARPTQEGRTEKGSPLPSIPTSA